MHNPQLDTFITVANCGSFSAAAAKLFITPTAVIKQMNLLESRLGVTLFHRSHQGLTLTKAGESLLKDARHIVKYSEGSIARAKSAERKEKRIVRVGVSLMTPSTALTTLWPKVKEQCPGMSMQVVTFENTETAPHMLKNLGVDIDIVVGVFDEAFLREHGCSALELSREPLCCALSADSELAKLPIVSLEDLDRCSLMLIRRGWNEDMDLLRDKIQADYPTIQIIDFPQYKAEVFNQCADEEFALVSLPIWDGVQPMLKTLPTDWGLSASYGFLHSSNPAPHVQEFLEAVKALKTS